MVVTEWVAFNIVKENLINYFTGSILILAFSIVLLSLLIFLSLGMDLRLAIILQLPLLFAFNIGGWLISSSGVSFDWIVYVLLMMIGLFIGWVFIKLFT